MNSSATTHKPMPGGLVNLIARNSAFVFGSQIGIKVASFVFSVFIVRSLGDSEFGEYSTILAYLAVFGLFTDLGIGVYAVREIAITEDRAKILIPQLMGVRIILSIIVILIAILLAPLFQYSSNIVYGIALAGFGLILYSIQGPFDVYLTARERLDYTSILVMINQGVFIVFGTIALLAGFGFMGLIGAMLVGVFVMTVFTVWISFRKTNLSGLKLQFHGFFDLVKSGLPFGISQIAEVFIRRFGIILLSILFVSAVVGWFSVAFNLVFALLLASQSFALAVYPSMVRAYEKDQQSLSKIVQRSTKYLLIISLPIAVGITLVAEEAIVLIYTEEFLPAIPVFRILIWALPALFLIEILSRAVAVRHLERKEARFYVANTIIALVLGLILIPSLGVVGAAIVMVILYVLLLLEYIWLLGWNFIVGDWTKTLFKPILAAFLMGFSTYFLGHQEFLISIAIGVSLYIIFLVLFRVIDESEFNVVRNLLRSKKNISDPSQTSR